jgi:3-phenylpropionate/cinnamic acid dioxygenase small subunit
MVLARSCALTAVSACLAEGLRQKDNTVRQRLREWCYSNFLAYRSRLEGLEGEEVFFVGRREDLLRRESGEWKIAQRRIIFDGLVLNAPNLSIVF